jgi:hypothetical protein
MLRKGIQMRKKMMAAVVITLFLLLLVVGCGDPTAPPKPMDESKPITPTQIVEKEAETVNDESKSQDYVSAGTPLEIGKWIVTAGDNEKKVKFTKKLGSDFFGETADEGYSFALVPVSIKNNTKSTESLTFVTWTLEDDEGYSYSIQTLADLHLSDDERLNVTDVPPGSVRGGYIVFQVRENVNDLYFGLETTLGSGKWHFEIN